MLTIILKYYFLGLWSIEHDVGGKVCFILSILHFNYFLLHFWDSRFHFLLCIAFFSFIGIIFMIAIAVSTCLSIQFILITACSDIIIFSLSILPYWSIYFWAINIIYFITINNYWILSLNDPLFNMIQEQRAKGQQCFFFISLEYMHQTFWVCLLIHFRINEVWNNIIYIKY